MFFFHTWPSIQLVVYEPAVHATFHQHFTFTYLHPPVCSINCSYLARHQLSSVSPKRIDNRKKLISTQQALYGLSFTNIAIGRQVHTIIVYWAKETTVKEFLLVDRRLTINQIGGPNGENDHSLNSLIS